MPQNPVIVRRASLTTGTILCRRPFYKLVIRALILLRGCLTAGSMLKREIEPAVEARAAPTYDRKIRNFRMADKPRVANTPFPTNVCDLVGIAM